jgi:hypothetical protein
MAEKLGDIAGLIIMAGLITTIVTSKTLAKSIDTIGQVFTASIHAALNP